MPKYTRKSGDQLDSIDPTAPEPAPEPGDDSPDAGDGQQSVSASVSAPARTSAPIKPSREKMTLEEYCNALSPADWESRKLYVTREGMPDVVQALRMKYNSKYTGILSGPFDEDYPFNAEMIRRTYGGGDFRVVLNWRDSKRPDHIEKQAMYSGLEGAPIWQVRETEAGIGVDEAAEQEEEERESRAEATMDRMVDRLEAAHQREVEAIRGAMEPEARATSGAVEMALSTGSKMVDAVMQKMAQPAAPSVSDKIMEAAVNKMLAPQPDPLEQMTKALQVMREIRKDEAPAPGDAGGLLGQFNQFKTLLEGFGISMPTALGGAAAVPETPTLAERGMELLGKAVEQGPMNWVNAWAILRQKSLEFKEREIQLELQRRGAVATPAGQSQAASGAPVNGVPAPVTVTASGQPQQQSGGNPMLNRMVETLARLYIQGVEPEAVAQTIADGFAPEFRLIAHQLDSQGDWWDNAAVLQWMAANIPPLSSAVSDPQFPAWAAKFWAEWKRITEPGTEEADAATSTVTGS